MTEYPIVVGGTRVTSKNMDDVLGDGTVKFESTGETQNSEGADSENPVGGITAGNGIVIGEGLFIKVPADGTIGELEAEDGSHYYILEAGKAAPKAVITVKEETVPKTGDPGNTGLWILLLGGSLLALVLSVVAGRKQGKKQR